MQLPEEHLTQFIELYKKHYDVVLDRETALRKGLQLCRFIEIVAFEPKGKEKNSNETKINHRL